MSYNIRPEWADHVKNLVDAAPPLSPAQRDRLAVLLRPKASGPDDPEFEYQVAEQRRRREEAERQARAEAMAARLAAEEERKAAARRCALYRHFDADGRLLYVGISANTPKRRIDHMQKAVWFRFQASETVQWYADRAAAELAEREAIAVELPIFNVIGAADGARERRLKYLADQQAWELLAEAKS